MRVLILAVVACAAATSPAFGVGYYNMPSSALQSMGMGFGPGYHAPLLLGPKMKAGIASQKVRRLPAPLPPPVCGGFDTPSVWGGAPMTSDAPWQAPLREHAQQPPSIGDTLRLRAAGVANAVAPSSKASSHRVGTPAFPSP